MAKVTPLDAKLAQTNEELHREPMDMTKYATKKAIAQGMLDVSLLTANISQLKYVMQVGNKHEFYTLLIILLSVAIFLQMSTGVLNLSMSMLNNCQLNAQTTQRSTNIVSFIITASTMLVMVVNILISVFDPTLSRIIEAPK